MPEHKILILNDKYFLIYREEEERRFEQSKQSGVDRGREMTSDSQRSGSREGTGRERERHNEERGDKYDRSSSNRVANDRYDYYNRNQPPPQPQIAPRFLKQKQQQANNASMGGGNRLDQDQDQRMAVPKEIRLRDRDDRPGDRNSNYDSSRSGGNRDSWQPNPRDHERDPRDREIQFKRNYDKTDRSSYSMGRDWVADKDNLNIKRKNSKFDSESDLTKEDRPNSRNSSSRPALKDDNEKGVFTPLPAQSLTPEIVSWADEPAESYDDCSPLSILTAAGGERGSSDDRHGKSGGHAPVPMPRDKLEADARAETKSNFVSLRRQQGQSQPTHGTTAIQSTSNTASEDHQDKKRPTEVVQNVWTNRSKTREQQHQANEASKSGEEKSLPTSSDKEPIVETVSDKNDDMDATNRKTSSGKDGRGRAAPPPSKVVNSNAAPMRRGTRRRESNPRYSDSYDEYYGEEDNGVHYKPSEQQQNPTVESRKSKSPDEEDPMRKDSRRTPAATASGPNSFRNRDNTRKGGNSRSYEEEDARTTKDNSNQRPPRFQQQQPQQPQQQQLQEEAPNKSKTLAHQTSQDGVSVTDSVENPSEHNLSDSGNSSGRSNRRGRGGNGNNDRRVRGPNDRSGKSEHDSQSDYYKESDGSSPCQPAAAAEVIVKEVVNPDDGSKEHDRKSAVKEQHNDKVRSDGRRNDRDRKDLRGDRSLRDERFRGPPKTNERYDSRQKSNLPPRLAKQMETYRYKMHKTESEGQAGSSVKESTLASSQQQQQTTTAWDKSSPSGAPSPALSSGMASLTLTSNESSVPEAADDKPILDGTTPPVQTIIFENTNFKSSSVTGLGSGDGKGRGTPPGQPQKCGVKAHQESNSSNKTAKGGDILHMNAGKEEMRLDLTFGSGLNNADSSKTSGTGYSQAHALQLPVGSKMAGVPRIHHISTGVQSPISPSTAELNMKIASVKKVIPIFF